MADCRLKRNRNLVSCKKKSECWERGVATERYGRGKRITDKYTIWRTKNPKPYHSGKNIIISNKPKFTDTKVSKKGYFVVRNDWSSFPDKLLKEGLSKPQAESFANSYMKKHDKC